MSLYRKQTGQQGEDYAAAYLEKLGLQIIAKNFRTRYGEIDLIARDKKETVFIEVKSRNSNNFGQPQEAVNFFKQKNLILTAKCYLQKHNLIDTDWRIDVIAISDLNQSAPKIEHIKNAVTNF